MSDLSNKVVVTIAPTGSLPKTAKTPHVPVTPKQIAEQVYECWREGAAVAHIHSRDKEENSVSNIEIFKQTMEEMDKYPDMDIIRQLSTGGRTGRTPQERGQMLSLGEEMASLATGSSNFPVGCNFNDDEMITHLASEMKKYGTKPEIEIFDTAMIFNAINYAEKGLIATPMHFNFVMGMPGSQPADEDALYYLYKRLPTGSTWSVTIIGREHVPLSTLALSLGGNVRVGIEDNIWYGKGALATNIAHVKRIKNIILAMGKELATPDEARQILSLPPRKKNK